MHAYTKSILASHDIDVWHPPTQPLLAAGRTNSKAMDHGAGVIPKGWRGRERSRAGKRDIITTIE